VPFDLSPDTCCWTVFTEFANSDFGAVFSVRLYLAGLLIAMKMKMNLKYWIIAPKQTFYVQQIESFKFKSQESLDSASSHSSSSSYSSASSSADDDEVR